QGMWAAKYLTARERSHLDGGDPSVLRKTPQFLIDQLEFPYTYGLAFVRGRYAAAGGWTGVDDLYQRPPTSSQQVLHPELYLSGRGWVRPPIPDVAGTTGCTPLRSGTLGEFQMTEVLAEHVSDATASSATTGWSGDAFA